MVLGTPIRIEVNCPRKKSSWAGLLPAPVRLALSNAAAFTAPAMSALVTPGGFWCVLMAVFAVCLEPVAVVISDEW